MMEKQDCREMMRLLVKSDRKGWRNFEHGDRVLSGDAMTKGLEFSQMPELPQ